MNLPALFLTAALCTSTLSSTPLPPLETAAQAAREAGEAFTIDISMAGDCMLSTYMGQSGAGSFNAAAASQPPAYFLEKVQDVFAQDDFTIVNLETVLTDRALAPVEKDHTPAYWFRGPSANARILTAGSVEAVSLANNHVGDYGSQGRADTVKAVEAVGLPYGNNERTLYLEKNGYRIAVICHGLWNEGQASQIIPRIQEAAAQSDYQIVFYHGGTEGTHTPDPWRVRASRRLVDAGADLVIGNHPHVLQPEEVYKGVHIVYSLGNFCYGGSRHPQNRTIIYKTRLTVKDGQLLSQENSIVPCYVYTGSSNNWQPAIIDDPAAAQRVLDFMAWKVSSPK